MRSRQSDGFTLVEVCLAIAVMAVGVLSMCGLYSLGYRENRQSVEDVAAAGYADAYLAPLVQGLSATNMTWTDWCQIGEKPSSDSMRSKGVADAVLPKDGWLGYVQQVGTSMDYRIKGDPRSTADSQFGKVVYLLNYFVCYYCSLVEYFSALHYSVAHCTYFVHALDNSGIACCKSFNEFLESFCMSREIAVSFKSSAVACFVRDMTSDAYSVAVALSNYGFIFHIYKLIFKR